MQALAGPGLKGLVNIGSSCYMNSVLQCFYAIPEIQKLYCTSTWAQAQVKMCASPDPPPLNLSVQLVKLGNALLTDRYTAPVDTDDSEEFSLLKFKVAPRMLKFIVGQGDDSSFCSLCSLCSMLFHISCMPRSITLVLIVLSCVDTNRAPRVFFVPSARLQRIFPTSFASN